MFRLLAGCFGQFEAAVHRVASVLLWTCAAIAAGVAVWMFPILGVVGLGMLIWCSRTTSVSGAHGTSRWASFFDLLYAGCLHSSGAASIGRAVGARPPLSKVAQLLIWSAPWRSRRAVYFAGRFGGRIPTPRVYVPSRIPHFAIFGPSGGGKSTCFAIPALLYDWASMVVMDLKGELFRATARHRARRFGHRIVVIDPFDVTGVGTGAGRLNLLHLCRGDARTAVDEARRLATALVVRSPNEHQPFFNDAATQIITCIIAFLLSECRRELASLNQVREILTDATMFEEMLEHLEQGEACGGLLKRQAGQIRCYQGQTKASVLAAANGHLEFLDSLPVAETLATTSFDPAELLTGRCTIYLCLPAERLEELQGLRRAVLTSLIHFIFAAGEDRRRRIPFILDEAGSLGEIDALYSALVYGRSYGFRLMFLMQSVAQVQDIFPESKAATFRATTAGVFCGVGDLETAEDVSKWVGNTTVLSHSRSRSDNWSRDVSESDFSVRRSHSFNVSRSTNETARALIQPEELLQAPPWAAVALLPGVRPIWLQKSPYYADRSRRGAWLGRLLHLGLAGVWTVGASLFLFLLLLAATPNGEPVRQELREIATRLLAELPFRP